MSAPLSFKRGARALVTGASGFIGAAVTRRLLQEGVEVHALYRRTPPENLHDAIWRQCDVEDGAAVRRIVGTVRPDFMFHLASHVSGSRDLEIVGPTLRSNLLSTVNVLTAATETGCRRVVLTGSMEEPAPSAAWSVPGSPYAAAKSAASAYGRMFHLLYGAPVVTLRLFMVYGPGQTDLKKLVPYTIMSLLDGTAPRLSSGRRNIDWVYVDDVVESYMRAALRDGVEGKTIDVATGNRVSVRALVERLVALINAGITPQFGALAERVGEQEPVADLTAAETLLQWRANTDLNEGLKRTVSWYREHRRIGAPVAITN